jgi:ribonuclease P protein component
VAAKCSGIEGEKGEGALLPKRERLSLEKEIRRVIGAGQYSGKRPLLYLVARDNGLSYSRLAVVAPKSLGNAVQRNRIRRRVYEIFADIKAKTFRQVDIIVYPRRAALRQRFVNVFGDFIGILKDCGIC